ncbi:hypothetical protein [Mesorhizobium sp.]|nr:hypothetical protein [Mesorhizobium sp.]
MGASPHCEGQTLSSSTCWAWSKFVKLYTALGLAATAGFAA